MLDENEIKFALITPHSNKVALLCLYYFCGEFVAET
jgi:hypothetical protein